MPRLSPRSPAVVPFTFATATFATALLSLLGILLPLVAPVPVHAQQQDIPEVVLELLDRAARARERERFDTAEEAYREAIKLAPRVVASYAGLGSLLFEQGQREEALVVFNAGLEYAPEDRDLRYNAAVLSAALERPEEALGHVERALAAHPRDAQLYLFQGSVLRQLERGEDALAALQRAAELAPREPRVHYALGNAYHDLGRQDEAVASYREAIDRDEDFLRAHYNLGAVLVELGRYEEAEQAYRVALAPIDEALREGEAVEAVHSRAYRNLGASYFQRQLWRDAVTAYAKAVRLDPNDASAQYHLGYAYYELGEDEAAMSTYRRALELEPALPLAYLHLARLARRQGQLEPAVGQAEAGLEYLQGTDRIAAYRLIAEVESERGRAQQAEPAWRQVLEAQPDDLPALLALGRLLRRDGRTEQARIYIDRAFELAPGEPAAALELAALARLQDPAAEEAIYRRVLSAASADGESGTELLPVRLNLALVLLKQRKSDEARQLLASLTSSLDRAPIDVETRTSLRTTYALLLASEGELEQARQQLDAIDNVQAHAPALLARAVLDALDGQTERAMESLEALRGTAGPVAPIGAGNLGQLLWLTDQSEARDLLEITVRLFPAWPGPRLALAEIAAREGRLSAAVDLLQALASVCADSEVTSLASTAEADSGATGETIKLVLSSTPDARAGLCARRSQVLGAVTTAQALATLESSPARARHLAGEALSLPLSAADRARSLFVRGTARLLLGADGRGDLSAALNGNLDRVLVPVARNNLGVALRRGGNLSEARQNFELARQAAPQLREATLNLGIVREQSGDNAAAMQLYEAYLAAGGSRAEVREWVENLRRFLP